MSANQSSTASIEALRDESINATIKLKLHKDISELLDILMREHRPKFTVEDFAQVFVNMSTKDSGDEEKEKEKIIIKKALQGRHNDLNDLMRVRNVMMHFCRKRTVAPTSPQALKDELMSWLKQAGELNPAA